MKNMPVYKDKNNTWYYSFSVKDPLTGKRKHRMKRGFKTKREAQAAEREEIGKKSQSSMTVRDLISLWEDHTQASRQTIQKHEEHFTIRFADYLDAPIESLTKPVLSRWRADLARDESFSTTTKNRTISYLKSLLRFASDIYDIDVNTSVLTRLKQTDDESLKEFDVWTPAEFNSFIKHVEYPLYALYFKFLFWTGCRRGEAIALQKPDLKDQSATIKYSQRTQTEGLKPTKKRTIRTIKLDSVLWNEMQPLMQTDGSYVFGGITGLSPNAIDNIFRKAIQESGVKRIRIHDLRHSHATWLINNGVNIVAVSKRLGHKDVSTTLSVYTHLLESTDNNMIAKIDEYKKQN